jgi:4-hydroxy-tetrahydrodipicolinate synthase
MAYRVFCRMATPFTERGELDEAALRILLQRLVQLDIGVTLGNPGAGEGHALTTPELGRIYRIGVEICHGKVPVHANPPEQPTARDTVDQLRIAAGAGVDLVNLYGPAGRHGYKPTDGELTEYFDTVLSSIKHPIAIAPDPTTGYTAKAEIVADMCEKYRHVKAVNLGEVGEDYLIGLMNRVGKVVDLHVSSPGAIGAIRLGASGVLSAEANIIPKTCRRYADLWAAGDGASAEAAQVYLQIRKFVQFVSRWGPSHARWLKLCMRALKFPGGQGGVREPYQLPPQTEIEKFSQGLLKLGIAEIDESAMAAGI